MPLASTPVSFDGRASRWLARPRIDFGALVSLVIACGLVPVGILVAVLHFGLGALVLYPEPAEGLRYLLRLLPDMALQAALEDFVFFGLVQQTLLRDCPGHGILVPVLFAATHVAVIGHPWGLPTWLAGGFLLSRLTRRAGGSLWPAVAVHASANLGLECFQLVLALNLPAIP